MNVPRGNHHLHQENPLYLFPAVEPALQSMMNVPRGNHHLYQEKPLQLFPAVEPALLLFPLHLLLAAETALLLFPTLPTPKSLTITGTQCAVVSMEVSKTYIQGLTTRKALQNRPLCAHP